MRGVARRPVFRAWAPLALLACSGQVAIGGADPTDGGTPGRGGSDSASGSSVGATGSSGAGSSSGAPTLTAVPTFAEIFTKYMAPGTPGNCGHTPGCHAEMSSASAAYRYLQGRGQLGGAPPTLTSAGSCLTWYGGDMPPGGLAASAQATADIDAWAAAGAQDN
jgi:hypothetical protein